MAQDRKSVGALTDVVPEITCSQCNCEIDVSDLEPFVKVECPDCGNTEIVPAKLGQFLLLELIGKGGMGGVYRAKDESLGRFVGIKVMLESLGDDQNFVETFKREARAIAQLNHPNIVQIYSFGKEKGQPYIVMELVSGERFDKMVEGGKPLDELLVMKTGLDIAQGLMAADEIGLIHGDIKPENILLDEKGNAKLVDFGLASFAHQAGSDSIWGTPYYIAPEKVKREKVDSRSDIYSLGATLYHALAGKPPFEGQTPVDVVKARLQDPPKPLNQHRPNISPKVEQLVFRMLQINPAQRYPNYSSLTSDMRKIVDDLKKTHRSPTLLKKITGKIMLTKKRQEPSSSGPKAGQYTAKAHQPSKVMIRASASSPEGSSALAAYKKKAMISTTPKKERKPMSLGFRVAISLITILVLAGGGYFIWKRIDAEKVRVRVEAYHLNEAKKNSIQWLAQFQEAALKIEKIHTSVEALIPTAKAAVETVLGEPLDPPPPPPPAEKPEGQESEAGAETPAATPEPAPTADNMGIPAGIMTEAEMKQLRGETAPVNVLSDALNPPSVLPDIAPGEPGAEGATDIDTTPQEPEIKMLTRSLITAAENITVQLSNVEGQETRAGTLNENIQKEPFLYKASEMAKELGRILTSAQASLDTARNEQNAAQTAFDKIEEIRKTVVAEREAIRKARDEEEKQRLAAEELRRREAARKALVEEELHKVTLAQGEQVMRIRQNKFKEAVDILKGQLTDYQTPEGQAALKVLIDRYTYLEDMRLFFIEQLSKEPLKWGWVQGPSQDVLGATILNVQIQARRIPWEEISVRQMLHFIKSYLDRQDVPLKKLGGLNLGAAIYCVECGGKSGAEASKQFLQKAVQYYPGIKEDADRLLPIEGENVADPLQEPTFLF